MNICTDESTAFFEVIVGAYFKAALFAAPVEQNKIRAAQRAWLIQRDQCMQKSKAERDKSRCDFSVYPDREAELGAIIHKPAAQRAAQKSSWQDFTDAKTGFRIYFPSHWKILRTGLRVSFGGRVSFEIKPEAKKASQCSQKWNSQEGSQRLADEVLGGKRFQSIVEYDSGMGQAGQDVHDYLFKNGQCLQVSYQLQSFDHCRSDESATLLAKCKIEEFENDQEDDLTKAVIHSIRFTPTD